MVISCCAYKCFNRQYGKENLSFHRFPLKNMSLLKKWILAVKRKDWFPNKYSYICSVHFLKTDYRSTGGASPRRILKKNAIPSVFSFSQIKGKSQDEENEQNEKRAEIIYIHVNKTALDTGVKQAYTAPFMRAEEIQISEIVNEIKNKHMKAFPQKEKGAEIVHLSADETVSDIDEHHGEDTDEQYDEDTDEQQCEDTDEQQSEDTDEQHSVDESCTPSPSIRVDETPISTSINVHETRSRLRKSLPRKRKTEIVPVKEIRSKFSVEWPSSSSSTTRDQETQTGALEKDDDDDDDDYDDEDDDDDEEKHKNHIKSLQRKVKILQQQLKRRDKKIISFQALLNTTKGACRMPDNLSEMFQDKYCVMPFQLLMQQLQNNNVKCKGRRYTTVVKEFAISLYSCSPKAYKFIRKSFNLPHPSMVRSWAGLNRLKGNETESAGASNTPNSKDGNIPVRNIPTNDYRNLESVIDEVARKGNHTEEMDVMATETYAGLQSLVQDEAQLEMTNNIEYFISYNNLTSTNDNNVEEVHITPDIWTEN